MFVQTLVEILSVSFSKCANIVDAVKETQSRMLLFITAHAKCVRVWVQELVSVCVVQHLRVRIAQDLVCFADRAEDLVLLC